MKSIIIILTIMVSGGVVSAKTPHCIEKTAIRSVEFYYGNMLKVATSGPEYILMTQGCDDLSLAGHYELKSASADSLSICKHDTVLLQSQDHEAYGACVISEILKEEL